MRPRTKNKIVMKLRSPRSGVPQNSLPNSPKLLPKTIQKECLGRLRRCNQIWMSSGSPNLDEFRSPNLGKCPKFGTPNSSPNAPRIHSLGELEATSHPSLVLGSFLMHFELYFHAESVDKSVQNATRCEHQFLNWLFISEQMMQRFLQKLESIKTLGGLFKNRLYDWYSLCESIT